MQEESKKIAAQRLLRAQLKHFALNQSKVASALDETTSFVPSFKLHAKSNHGPKEEAHAVVGESTSAGEKDGTGEDVQWVDGYESLHAKDLDASEARARGEEDAEMEWELPEDYDDLSPDALAAMPAHIRKSLIEEARRRQRMESRAHYLPVAGNPALYSQTQLSNFLNSR